MLQTTALFFAISFILWPNSAYKKQNRHDTQNIIYPNLPLPSTHSSGNSPNTTHLANLHATMIKVRCRTAMVAKSCHWVAPSMPRWHLGDDSKNTQHATANVL